MTKTHYGVVWNPADEQNKVTAEFAFEPAKRPRAELMGAAMSAWVAPDGSPIPMVHAEIAGRGLVTMIAAQWSGISGGLGAMRIQLVAHHALVGVLLDKPDEQDFRRVELDMPVLELLLGPRPARPDTFPKMPTSRAKSVRVTLEDRKHEWDDGTTRITLEYQWNMSVGSTRTNVSMAPKAILSSANPRSLQEWAPTVRSLLKVVSVATGAQTLPTRARLFRKRNPNKRERYDQEVEWLGNGIGEQEDELDLDHHKVLVGLDAFDHHPDGLPGMLDEYPTLEDEQEVFLGLLTGGIADTKRPLRNRYLDMTAALEAYHSQALEDPDPVDEHNAKVEAVLERARDKGLNSKDRSFLKHAAKERGPSLETRLSEAAAEVGLGADWAVPPNRMAEIRNQIAHGERIEEYSAELKPAFEQAFDVARRLVMLRLGAGLPQ